MKGLHDKVVVVAGGATGIGAGCARRLAEAGAIVVVGDLDGAGAEKTAAEIRDAGGVASSARFDIAVDDSVGALIDGAVAEYGHLHGVHVNAADLSPGTIGRDTDIVDIDLAVWDRTMTVNLRGHMLTARHAMPHLLAAGGGGIVFTSSADSLTGDPHRPAYAASKAGVNSLARHISSRWGKQGIRANAVLPGLVLTGALRADGAAEIREHALAIGRSPRLGQPEDIAAMVALLLSDEGAWITGQTIEVNGGLHFTTG